MIELEHVPEVLEYTNEEKKAAIKVIGTLQRIKSLKLEIL